MDSGFAVAGPWLTIRDVPLDHVVAKIPHLLGPRGNVVGSNVRLHPLAVSTAVSTTCEHDGRGALSTLAGWRFSTDPLIRCAIKR